MYPKSKVTMFLKIFGQKIYKNLSVQPNKTDI